MKASKANAKQAQSLAELAARAMIVEGKLDLILSLLQQPKAPAKVSKGEPKAHDGGDDVKKTN